jgi:hypothetical protein
MLQKKLIIADRLLMLVLNLFFVLKERLLGILLSGAINDGARV